jgi:hypothetical protein
VQRGVVLEHLPEIAAFDRRKMASAKPAGKGRRAPTAKERSRRQERLIHQSAPAPLSCPPLCLDQPFTDGDSDRLSPVYSAELTGGDLGMLIDSSLANVKDLSNLPS